jgi:hypothetical protein
MITPSTIDKIHFTGSINSGMSGGPTVDGSGSVVGVNVQSGGDQLGFLVPVSYLRTLVNNISSQQGTTLASLAQQIADHQTTYYSTLLQAQLKTITLGDYRVPTADQGLLKCWSNQDNSKEQGYRSLTHSCDSEGEIFLTDEIETGSLMFHHTLLTNISLNRFQFSSLVEKATNSHLHGSYGGEEEDFTQFGCKRDLVATASGPWRVSLCLRAYKKLSELYDVVIVAVSRSSDDSAIVSHLIADGIRSETAQMLSKRYLEALQ